MSTPINDQEMAEPSKGYELSGKIMLSAIIVLFAIVIFMVGLHLYARWYLIRLRRRQLERRRQRRSTRTHVVFYTENNRQLPVAADKGLEPEVLKTLPVFLHSSEPVEPAVQECAVCLSEFEEKEIVRLLPKCNHCFHIECIDMWFHSHSTCPLCRSAVEPVFYPVQPVIEPAVNRDEPATSSRSGVRKGFEVRIDVPVRRLENESMSQSSPTSRMLSRILSMGRMRSPRVTTPCGVGELDLESGNVREASRVLTPR